MDQQEAGAFTVPGTSGSCIGKRAVVSLLGPYDATVNLEARSLAVRQSEPMVWLPIQSGVAADTVQTHSFPVSMEWRIDVPAVVSGKVTYVLETTKD